MSQRLTIPKRERHCQAGTRRTRIEFVTIKKTEFPAAQLWPSIIRHAGGLGEIAERISLVDPARDVEVKNANRWMTARPDPRNAWLIGEALRFHDENVEALLDASSGLLALYWFGHLDDFVGVLGCSDTTRLLKFEHLVTTMIWSLRATIRPSVFDGLAFNHPIFVEGADEFSLRQIADTKIIPVSLDVSFEKEARILNERRRALSIWMMRDDLHAAICDGAKKWFDCEDRAGTINEANSRALQLAYAIARSNIDDDDAAELVMELLTRWFYSRAMPEPMPESVEMLYSVAVDPDSATSRAILNGFRSYGLINE